MIHWTRNAFKKETQISIADSNLFFNHKIIELQERKKLNWDFIWFNVRLIKFSKEHEMHLMNSLNRILR